VAVGCSSSSNDDNLVTRTDIVTNTTDANLVNAWGLAFNPTGIAWVNSNGTGVSVVFDVNGNHVIGPVAIPPPPIATDPPSTPTGIVFNGNGNAFLGDAFISVTEDGTIAGWQPTMGSTATLRVDNSAGGAVYKGVAIGQASNGDARIYAANFSNGSVDVFDGSYHPVPGGFVDSALPAGFAPFDAIVVPGGELVSYALQNQAKHDDVAGIGNGFVDFFDADGNLLGRLISGGPLNSPWGMALSPSNFGAAPNSLLVGNFGDGLIHFYSFNTSTTPPTAALAGTLNDATLKAPIVIDGLWSLQFGPGTANFASNVLFFTAGPQMETQGVFGSLTSVNSQ
jgi:uncharacterized protein (TIGR03118 family)